MDEAVQFFYDNAGFSYDPKTETAEQGQERCARELAAAEQRMKSGPYFIDLESDPEPWDGDVPYDGPLWEVTLYRVPQDSAGPEVLGSLGSVAAEVNDPYIRVVAANLALEYIPA